MFEQIVTQDDIRVLAACFNIIEQFNNKDANTLIDYIQAAKAEQKFKRNLEKLQNVSIALAPFEVENLRTEALRIASEIDNIPKEVEDV